MTRKDLIIVALATFCLTATLFLIIPTRSQDDRYDPWLDINDDGIVNMLDIGETAAAFGSSGDPTKNVNMTNWPSDYEVQRGTMNLTGRKGFEEVVIFCGGYSRLSILMSVYDINLSEGIIETIYLANIIWEDNPYMGPPGISSFESVGMDRFNLTVTTAFDGSWSTSIPNSYTTETKAPWCRLTFLPMLPLQTNWWLTIDYAIYLRND